MSAPASLTAFETFLTQWVEHQSGGSNIGIAYVYLDTGAFKIADIDYELLLKKISEWAVRRGVVASSTSTQSTYGRGSFSISFQLGEVSEDALERLRRFFINLNVALNITVTFSGKSSFKKVSSEAIAAFMLELRNHPQVTSISVGDTDLWALEFKNLQGIIDTLKIPCPDSFKPTIRLWETNSEILRSTVSAWSAENRFGFAKVQLEMLALSGYTYTNPFPFPLTFQEHKDVIQDFLHKNLAHYYFILNRVLPTLSLTVEERTALSDYFSSCDYFIAHWVRMTPNHSLATWFSEDLNLSRFKIEQINFESLLSKIQEWVSTKLAIEPSQSMESYQGQLHIEFQWAEVKENTLERLSLFFKRLSLPIKMAVSFHGESSFTDVSPEAITTFISGLYNHPQIRHVSLGNTNLWTVELKALQKIIGLLKVPTQKSSKASIRLWESNSEKLRTTVSTWPAENRLDFARVQLEILILDGYVSSNPFPFILTLEEHKAVIQAFLNDYPAQYHFILNSVLPTLSLTVEERAALTECFSSFEYYIERWIQSAPTGNCASPVHASLDLSRYKVDNIDFDLLLNKVQTWGSSSVTVDSSQGITNHGTINIAFQLGEVTESTLKKLNHFFKRLSLPVGITVQFLGESSFSNIPPESIATFISDLNNDSQVINVSFQNSDLWKLDPQVLEKLFKTLRQPVYRFYKGGVTSRFMQTGSYVLWQSQDGKLKSAAQEWLPEKRSAFASIHLEMLVLGNRCYEASFPFSLDMEDYKSVFQTFLNNHPSQIGAISQMIPRLDLNEAQRLELSGFLTAYSFKAYLISLQRGGFNNIDINQFPWEIIDFNALLETLKTAQFPQGCWLNLIVNFKKIDEKKLKSFTEFLDGLSEFSHPIQLQINQYGEDKNFDERLILELINYLAHYPSPIQCFWINSQLWRLSLPMMEAIYQSVIERTNDRNFSIRLWDGEEPLLITECQTWDEARRAEYVQIYMQKEECAGNWFSNFPPFPFALSLQVYRKIFGEYLAKRPDHAEKVLSWAKHCKLLSEETNVELVEEISKQKLLLSPETISQLNLNDLRLQTEGDLQRRQEEFKKYALRNLQSMSLDLSEIDLEQILLYARLIKSIESANLMYSFQLTLLDSDFVKNKCQKIIAFIRVIAFAKMRVLSLREINLNGIQERDTLLELARAIVSNQNIQGLELSFFGNQGQNITFDIFEELFSRGYSVVTLNGDPFLNLSSEQFLTLLERLLSYCYQLNISSCKIEQRELEVLSKVRQLVQSKTLSSPLSLWNVDAFKVANEQRLPALSGDKRVELARIFFEMEMCTHPGQEAGSNPTWLGLEEPQYFEFIQSLIQRLQAYYWQQEKIRQWIKHIPFSYERRFYLILKLAEKMPYIQISEFYLKTEDRLQLFLQTSRIDDEFDMASTLSRYDLFTEGSTSSVSSSSVQFSSLKAMLLFQPWRHLLDMEEEEVQFMPEVIDNILDELHTACKRIWEDNNFYESSLQAMKDWPRADAYKIFKLLNMMKWFTCTAAYLTMQPNLDLREINKVLSELRGYPDPTVRRHATDTLLTKVYQDPKGPVLYSKLCKKHGNSSEQIASHLLIPAIFLSQIVLEGENASGGVAEGALKTYSAHRLEQAVKQHDLRSRAYQILLNVPNFYKEGHYFRQMVAAFQAVASCSKISAETKLMLIEHGFGIQQSLIKREKAEALIGNLVKQAAENLKCSGEELDKLAEDYQKEFEYWRNSLFASSSTMGRTKFDELVEARRQEKLKVFELMLINLQQITSSNVVVEDLLKKFSEQCRHYLTHVLWEEIVFKPLDGLIRKSKRENASLLSSSVSSKAALSQDVEDHLVVKKQVKSIEKHLKEECKGLSKTLLGKANKFLTEEALQAQQSSWLLLQSIELWPHIEKLNGLKSIDFDKIARELRTHHFNLSEAEIQYYEQRFSNRHNNSALFTYLNKIRLLPKAERERMEALFIQIIKAILSNNSEQYFALRYDEQLNPHLRQLFEGRPQLKEAWKKGAAANPKGFIEEHHIHPKVFVPNYADFLYTRIYLHQHLPAKNYPDFQAYLTAKKQNDHQACQTIEQKLIKMAARIVKPKPGVQVYQVSSLPDHRADIQLNLIRLANLMVSPATKQEEVKLLLSIKKAFQFGLYQEGREFMHDLEMLLSNLRSDVNAKDIGKDKDIDPRWKLVDTDDYWTTFMVGTDVDGSCQRVDGSPHLNKCLLAYVIDGKNRVLAIQDEAGVTVARCILRMLWDPEAKRPVLYQEDIYPDTLSMQYKLALIEFAKQRAETLGLTLVSSSSKEESRKYSHALEASGSFVPWEYVDAIHSAQKDGNYTIHSSVVIYSPYLEKADLASAKELVAQQCAFSERMEVASVDFGSVRPAYNVAELLGNIIGYLSNDDSNDTEVGIGYSQSSASSSLLLSSQGNAVAHAALGQAAAVTPAERKEREGAHFLDGLLGVERPSGENEHQERRLSMSRMDDVD